MNPFYLECCNELKWEPDQNVLKQMKDINEERIKVINFLN